MVAVKWFSYTPLIPEHSFQANQPPPKPPKSNWCTYSLPWVDWSDSPWKSYTVEGLSRVLYGLSVYGVVFPLLFLLQSLLVIPAHLLHLPGWIYRQTFATFQYLDERLY